MNFSSDYCPVFPILVCNQSCTYCINHAADDANLNYRLSPAEKWIPALNQLENVTVMNFCGGEPTLHPGLADIINGLRRFKSICLGSNASDRSVETCLRIQPRPDFNVATTFHPTQVTAEKFIANFKQIQARHPGSSVSYVHHPDRPEETTKYQNLFGQHGLGLGILGYRGYDAQGKFHPWILEERSGCKKRSKAVCHFDFCTPIGPDGKVYACHYYMYAQAAKGVIGDIFQGQMTYPKTMVCEDYGYCNPCEEARTIVPI